jgi:hypothetical protein
MQNEMRDRLIKDLRISKTEWLEKECDHETDKELVEYVADYILDDGWIRLPCKVGDKTFLLLEKINGDYVVNESKCIRITDNGYGKSYSMFIDCKEIGNTLECGISDFGKWVFLTKSEAEQKLKEMRGE